MDLQSQVFSREGHQASTAPTKPTIILVPGTFHKASHFYKLAMQLTVSGYTASILDLPSTTSSEPQTPIYDTDVTTIAEAIREFIQVGRDVVLVMHGLAGGPGTQAACGFARKASDGAEGLADEAGGAVVKLIYLAAWLPMENQDLFSLPWPADFEPFYATYEQDNRFIRAHNPREKLYNDIVDTRVAASAAAALEPKAVDHDFVGPAECAWRKISSAYILCEKDEAFPPAVTEAMIELVESGGVKVRTERLKSGHAPMLRVPRETSMAIIRLIEDSA